MAILVREAEPSEYEEAGHVTALAYREFVPAEDSDDWEEYLSFIADVSRRADRTTILVAVEDGRLLGSLTLELQGRTETEDPPLGPGEAHVRMLGVDPGARQRGVARALMDEGMRLAREAGKTRLTLHTTGRMEAAQRMYERMGFRRTADRVFPDGFTLLGYERDL